MAKYNLLSEDDLLILLKKDDKLAFAEIYERNKLILHMHALNKTKIGMRQKTSFRRFLFLYGTKERR